MDKKGSADSALFEGTNRNLYSKTQKNFFPLQSTQGHDKRTHRAAKSTTKGWLFHHVEQHIKVKTPRDPIPEKMTRRKKGKSK